MFTWMYIRQAHILNFAYAFLGSLSCSFNVTVFHTVVLRICLLGTAVFDGS